MASDSKYHSPLLMWPLGRDVRRWMLLRHRFFCGGVLGCEGQFTPVLLRTVSYLSEPSTACRLYETIISSCLLPQNKIK